MAPMAYLRADSAKLRRPTGRPIELDEPLDWACSSRGWNCCVGNAIPLTPYDVVRVRHAKHKTSQQLIDDDMITFEWRGGLMTAWFAQLPFQGNQRACIFYEELTNDGIRRVRDEEPERFASFPPEVQRAADRTGDYRVTALCAIHSSRPEACRAFPFMLRSDWNEQPEQPAAEVVHRCGTCALKQKTTVRQVLLENGLDEFWRPAETWRIVKLYLVSRGLGYASDPKYRSLPLDLETRTEIWNNCFNPDAFDAVTERFPDQWHTSEDLDGDDQILRLVLTSTLDRVDALVADSGVAIDDLGLIGEPPAVRPDLDRLLDPSRPVLPVIAAAVAS